MSNRQGDEEHPEDSQAVHGGGQAPRTGNQRMPVRRVEAALPAKRDEHCGEAGRARKAEVLKAPVEEVCSNPARAARQHEGEPHCLNEYGHTLRANAYS